MNRSRVKLVGWIAFGIAVLLVVANLRSFFPSDEEVQLTKKVREQKTAADKANDKASKLLNAGKLHEADLALIDAQGEIDMGKMYLEKRNRLRDSRTQSIFVAAVLSGLIS